MAASEAAVTAVMKALDKHVLDWNVNTTWHCSCGVRLRNRGEAMTHRAVAAADAAVDADRASIQAETLREAIREVQWVYDLQCPPRSDWFGKDEFGRGAFCAHRWWSTVLGGALNRLRDRADRIEGKP